MMNDPIIAAINNARDALITLDEKLKELPRSAEAADAIFFVGTIATRLSDIENLVRAISINKTYKNEKESE